jgi:hypothetical protein
MKTTTLWMLSTLALIGLAMPFSHPAYCANPAPATKPDAANPDAKRLTFLGDQLSADEAAIAAINRALLQAGYHAAVANERAANAAKDSYQMDRQGGAPVPWQQFYGRTARDFIMHDKYSPVYHQVARPDQLDYVYRANNNQIDSAKAEVNALGRKVDALLARRRELEAEQSSLWATIAFESIGNRDISLRSLYRNELKAKPSLTDDNRPDGARVAALRAAVLYLRTLAHTTESLSGSLETDQESAYTSLRDTLQKAGDQLTESAATFSDTAGVDAAEAKQMSEVAAQAKQIQALCKDVCEAFRKAKDADAAGEGEEQRKLLFRGTLQDSLFTFAESAGQLDDTLGKMSETWEIRGQAGVKSSDQPLEVTAEATHSAPVQPNSTSDASTPVVKVPLAAQEAQGERRIDLLKLIDPAKNTIEGHWSFKNGALTCEPYSVTQNVAKIEIPYIPPAEYDYQVVFVRSMGELFMYFTCSVEGHQFQWRLSEQRTIARFFFSSDGRPSDGGTAQQNANLVINGQKTTVTVKVRRKAIEAYVNGQLISTLVTDQSKLCLPEGFGPNGNTTMAFAFRNSAVAIESAQVTEITGEGKMLRADAAADQAVKETNANTADSSSTIVPAPVTPPAPVSAIPSGQQRIDLMKLVDVNLDKRTGRWTQEGGTLVGAAPNGLAAIEFPYVPPEEYDYRVNFVRTDGNATAVMVIICFAGGRQFEWIISENQVGFGLIGGKPQNRSTTKTDHPLIADGKPCTILVKVRKTGVEAYLDNENEPVSTLKTDYQEFSLPPGYQRALHANNTIAVVVRGQTFTLKSAEVIEITGQGKLLRAPAEPAIRAGN